MERDEKLTSELRKFSKKLGVDIVGLADPKHFNRFEATFRPESYLSDSKTVIIIGIHLYDVTLDAWYSSKKNFHFADSILEVHCHRIKDFLFKKGYNSKVMSYTPGLFLKDSAALAGVGPIGKNNLLITKKFGSQVRLRALTTNAPLVVGEPILESEYCKECKICQESCPADAFQDGKYNKDICLKYNLSHLKKLSEYTSIWCNVCIDSCPVGKK